MTHVRDAFSRMLAMLIALFFSIGSPLGAELPPLNQIVVAGGIESLLRILRSKRWSAAELGSALIATAGANEPEMAEILLSAGAAVDFSVLQRTPLIISAVEDSPEVADVLLKHGADPNFVSTFDWRPLHFAIASNGSNNRIIELLVRNGAQIDAPTNLSVAPLHRAAGFCQKSTVEVLLKLGADKTLRDKYGQTAYQRALKAGCLDLARLLAK